MEKTKTIVIALLMLAMVLLLIMYVTTDRHSTEKSRGSGTRSFNSAGSINAGTIEGYLVVNGANAKNISGTLTISGNS